MCIYYVYILYIYYIYIYTYIYIHICTTTTINVPHTGQPCVGFPSTNISSDVLKGQNLTLAPYSLSVNSVFFIVIVVMSDITGKRANASMQLTVLEEIIPEVSIDTIGLNAKYNAGQRFSIPGLIVTTALNRSLFQANWSCPDLDSTAQAAMAATPLTAGKSWTYICYINLIYHLMHTSYNSKMR